jgi:hypothetical protein
VHRRKEEAEDLGGTTPGGIELDSETEPGRGDEAAAIRVQATRRGFERNLAVEARA